MTKNYLFRISIYFSRRLKRIPPPPLRAPFRQMHLIIAGFSSASHCIAFILVNMVTLSFIHSLIHSFVRLLARVFVRSFIRTPDNVIYKYQAYKYHNATPDSTAVWRQTRNSTRRVSEQHLTEGDVKTLELRCAWSIQQARTRRRLRGEGGEIDSHRRLVINERDTPLPVSDQNISICELQPGTSCCRICVSQRTS